jgi:hypothetical protein
LDTEKHSADPALASWPAGTTPLHIVATQGNMAAAQALLGYFVRGGCSKGRR